MSVYVAICIILFFFWLITVLNHRFENLLLGVGIIILIFFACIRATSVGTDTYDYYINFLYITNFESLRTYSGTQRGWFYVNSFFNSITNYSVFLIFCYSIIYGCIGYFIKTLSKDKLLSLLLFFLFFYGSTLNIMRQYIAVGIYCVGLVFLSKGQDKFFIVSLIIASVFHFTALLLLPIIFIKKIRLNSLIVNIAIASSFVCGVIVNIMAPVVMSLSFLVALNEGAMGYLDSWGGERNIVTNLVVNIVFLISYFYSKNKASLLFKIWFFYIVLFNLFGASPQGNRIFIYLFITMIVAIANIFKEIKYSVNKVLYVLMVLGYGIGYWYIVLSSGQNDLIPYQIR